MLSTVKKKGKAKQQSQQDQQPGGQGSEGAELGGASGAVKISLNFKRYVFDPNKRMIQWYDVVCW